jgi:polyisoprenoid-binding protein YceI
VAIPLVLIGGPFIFFHFADGSSAPPLTLPVGPGGSSGPVTGDWTLTKPSQVQYRVDEILLGQTHTAVGSTEKVSGSMIIAGQTVTYVHVKVDMASVTSDQVSRDVQFRDYILKTGTYPNAYFTLTQPIELGAIPATGQTVSKSTVGSLTLRGMSREVEFPLVAEREGNEIVVNGSLRIRFSLWHIPNPSFGVAQVGQYGTIGVLLYFAPK